MEKIKLWFEDQGNKNMVYLALGAIFLVFFSSIYIYKQHYSSRENQSVDKFSTDGLVDEKKDYDSKMKAYKEKEKKKGKHKSTMIELPTEKRFNDSVSTQIDSTKWESQENEKLAIINAGLQKIRDQNNNSKQNIISNDSDFDPYGDPGLWEEIQQDNINQDLTSLTQYDKNQSENTTVPPEEPEIIGLGGIALNQANNSQYRNLATKETSTKLIRAKLIGNTDKKNRVTTKNPYVEIRLLENMYINGNLIKKNKILIAEAKFEKRLSLKINHILLGQQSITCDIEVFDSHGQPALQIIGGTGAEAQEEVTRDISQDIASNSQVEKIPGASGIIKKIFTKTPKVYLKPDLVYLKIK